MRYFGLTGKQLKEKMTETLARSGAYNRFALVNIINFIGTAAAVATTRVDVIGAFFEGADPRNDDEFDYVDALMSEMTRNVSEAHGAGLKAYITDSIAMAEFDWSRIQYDLAQGNWTEDVKAALILAQGNGGAAAITRAKVIGSIWKHMHRMPRITQEYVGLDKDGEQIREKILVFGLLKDSKDVKADPASVAKWRTVKRWVREQTALDIHGLSVLTAEAYAGKVAEVFGVNIQPKATKAGGYNFPLRTSVVEVKKDPTSLDKLRLFCASYAATVSQSTLVGVFYVDGITTAQVDAVLGMCKVLGLEARLITADDEGVPGQIRVEYAGTGSGAPLPGVSLDA
jgi:hypothetical protein